MVSFHLCHSLLSRSENLLGAMLEAMPEGWPEEIPFDASHFARFDPTRCVFIYSSGCGEERMVVA